MANGQIDWQRYETDPAYKAEADRMIAEQSRRFSRGHKTIFDEIAAQMPSPAGLMGAGQSPWTEEELRATGQAPRQTTQAQLSVPSPSVVAQDYAPSHIEKTLMRMRDRKLASPRIAPSGGDWSSASDAERMMELERRMFTDNPPDIRLPQAARQAASQHQPNRSIAASTQSPTVSGELLRLIRERLNEGLDTPHTDEERQQAQEFLQSHPARASREALHRRNLSNIEARGASIPDVSAMHGYRTEGGGLDMAAIENASVPFQRTAGRVDERYAGTIPFGVSGHRPARLDAEPQFASATVRNRALRGELPAGAPDPGSPTFTSYLRDKIGINPDAFGKYMRRLEESDVAFAPSADTPVSGAASNFRLRGSDAPLTGDALADRRREVGSIVDTMKQRMQERLDEGRSNLAQRQQPAGDSGNDWVSLVQRAAALKRMGVSDEGIKFMLSAAISEKQNQQEFGQKKELVGMEIGARTSEGERDRTFKAEQDRLTRMAEDARAAERRAFDASVSEREAQLKREIAQGSITAQRELADLQDRRQAEREAAAAEDRRKLAGQEAATDFAGSLISGGHVSPEEGRSMLPEAVRSQLPPSVAATGVPITAGKYDPQKYPDPNEYITTLLDQAEGRDPQETIRILESKGVTKQMLRDYEDALTPGGWTALSDVLPLVGDNFQEREARIRRLNQLRKATGKSEIPWWKYRSPL